MEGIFGGVQADATGSARRPLDEQTDAVLLPQHIAGDLVRFGRRSRRDLTIIRQGSQRLDIRASEGHHRPLGVIPRRAVVEDGLGAHKGQVLALGGLGVGVAEDRPVDVGVAPRMVTVAPGHHYVGALAPLGDNLASELAGVVKRPAVGCAVQRIDAGFVRRIGPAAVHQ